MLNSIYTYITSQNPILAIILLTLAPFLELRASIPFGLLTSSLTPSSVIFLAIIANIALAPLLWFFVNYIMHLFLKIKFIDKLYQKQIIKIQKKLKPKVEKYGVLGLAIFIGLPLPGSGVYSGALGAYLLGYKFKDYLIASIIGVIIAATVVSLVVLLGNGAWSIFLKV